MSKYLDVTDVGLIEMVLESENLSQSARELVGRFEDAIEELESLRPIREFISQTGVPADKIAGALNVLYNSLGKRNE